MVKHLRLTKLTLFFLYLILLTINVLLIKDIYKQILSNNRILNIHQNEFNLESKKEKLYYTSDKNTALYRIAIINNSLTSAKYGGTIDKLSKLLEEDLNTKTTCRQIHKFEIVNLGVPNYDIQNTLEQLITRGTASYPNLVIWILNNRNFDAIDQYYRPIEKKQYNQNYQTTNQESRIFNLSILVSLNKNSVSADNYPDEENHQKITGEIFNLLLKNYLNDCQLIDNG